MVDCSDQFCLIADDGITLDGARDGDTFDPEFDLDRLNKQMRRVWDVMRDGRWRTLSEISSVTGDPEASISARLRDFRKKKFGGLVLNRRRRFSGLYEYQISPEGIS